MYIVDGLKWSYFSDRYLVLIEVRIFDDICQMNKNDFFKWVYIVVRFLFFFEVIQEFFEKFLKSVLIS